MWFFFGPLSECNVRRPGSSCLPATRRVLWSRRRLCDLMRNQVADHSPCTNFQQPKITTTSKRKRIKKKLQVLRKVISFTRTFQSSSLLTSDRTCSSATQWTASTGGFVVDVVMLWIMFTTSFGPCGCSDGHWVQIHCCCRGFASAGFARLGYSTIIWSVMMTISYHLIAPS